MHCIGIQRGRQHRFIAGARFLRLSHPRLVSILFSAPSLFQINLFQKLFHLVPVLFWWVCKPIFKYSSFQLQIRYHAADKCVIASEEIASATLLRTRYHTADKHGYRYRRHRLCYSLPNMIPHCRQTHLSLPTNRFCAGQETHTRCCRRMCFTLETNMFSHTYTHS